MKYRSPTLLTLLTKSDIIQEHTNLSVLFLWRLCMPSITKQDGVVSGNLFFSPAVTPDVLVQMAEEWLADSDGDRFQSLYIRPDGKDRRHCIVFQYRFDPGPKGYKSFYHKVTDMLKRRFGNDFIGWSIASPTWILR